MNSSCVFRKTAARISEREYTISNTPKTDDSVRQIPLTDQARRIIDDQRASSHAFRDTFATRAVEQGMAIKTLAEPFF